jgi:hypothetical protein
MKLFIVNQATLLFQGVMCLFGSDTEMSGLGSGGHCMHFAQGAEAERAKRPDKIASDWAVETGEHEVRPYQGPLLRVGANLGVRPYQAP